MLCIYTLSCYKPSITEVFLKNECQTRLATQVLQPNSIERFNKWLKKKTLTSYRQVEGTLDSYGHLVITTRILTLSSVVYPCIRSKSNCLYTKPSAVIPNDI